MLVLTLLGWNLLCSARMGTSGLDAIARGVAKNAALVSLGLQSNRLRIVSAGGDTGCLCRVHYWLNGAPMLVCVIIL